jgi:hypothetical protein
VSLASKEEPIVGLHVERDTKGDTQGRHPSRSRRTRFGWQGALLLLGARDGKIGQGEKEGPQGQDEVELLQAQ